jgi:hypothetical protein
LDSLLDHEIRAKAEVSDRGRSIARVLRPLIARHFAADSRANLRAFGQWIQTVPDEDLRFKLLGTLPARDWAFIVEYYIDAHLYNDSFGLTAVNLYLESNEGKRLGHGDFEKLFTLMLLDAALCELAYPYDELVGPQAEADVMQS